MVFDLFFGLFLFLVFGVKIFFYCFWGLVGFLLGVIMGLVVFFVGCPERVCFGG